MPYITRCVPKITLLWSVNIEDLSNIVNQSDELDGFTVPDMFVSGFDLHLDVDLQLINETTGRDL